MSDRPILIVSGTNRPGSNAARIAAILQGNYEKLGFARETLSLVDLPKDVFDGAAYASKPPEMVTLQKRVLDSLGLHLVVPEYNGSFPGVLKYFIDMLKFPESFVDKPVAFVGEANGVWGGLRAVEQLQMIFGYRNAYMYPERVFIPGINQKFDATGGFNDEAINSRLAMQAQGFVEFTRRFR